MDEKPWKRKREWWQLEGAADGRDSAKMAVWTRSPENAAGSRFSLRTLFLFVTVVAPWLGWEYRIVAERREVRRQIVEGGGWIRENEPWRNVIKPQPSLIRRLFGDELLTGYDIHYPLSPDESAGRRPHPKSVSRSQVGVTLLPACRRFRVARVARDENRYRAHRRWESNYELPRTKAAAARAAGALNSQRVSNGRERV